MNPNYKIIDGVLYKKCNECIPGIPEGVKLIKEEEVDTTNCCNIRLEYQRNIDGKLNKDKINIIFSYKKIPGHERIDRYYWDELNRRYDFFGVLVGTKLEGDLHKITYETIDYAKKRIWVERYLYR